MKKLFVTLLIVLFLVTPALGFQGAKSSGEKTSDTAIMAGPGYITAVYVITDGSNNAKVILYDNASAASGTVMLEMTVVASDNYGGRSWVFPAEFFKGIYVDVSGTGASYIIEYITK